MRRPKSIGFVPIMVALIVLLLVTSSCSPLKGSGSDSAVSPTSWHTPTPISAAEPNSNGAMVHANVHGTGVFVTNGVRPPIASRWQFKTTGQRSTTTPALQGSTVYFGHDGSLYAVDTQTGQQNWTRELDNQHTSAPAVAADTVYASGWEQLFALSTGTGNIKCVFAPEKGSGDGYYLDPLVEGGTVYFAGWSSIYALDSNSGKVKWRLKLSGLAASGPTFYGRTVYIGTESPDLRHDTYLYALDSETGQEKWKTKLTGDGAGGAVAVTDGVVYVGTFKDGLLALDATSGQEKWRYNIGSGIATAPAVAYGTVFITNKGSLYAVDAQTGKETWRLQGSADLTSDPVIADGIIYFGTTTAGLRAILAGGKSDGELHAVEAQSGQELGKFGVEGGPSGAPAVLDGTVYVGTGDGSLYSIK